MRRGAPVRGAGGLAYRTANRSGAVVRLNSPYTPRAWTASPCLTMGENSITLKLKAVVFRAEKGRKRAEIGKTGLFPHSTSVLEYEERGYFART